MATININGYSTLLDIASRLDPKGKIARIAETLNTDCPLLQDMPWVEANGPDGHLITTRTGLPGLTWRKYNQGVLPSKSQTGQFTETTGMLDGVSKVDVALAKRNGNAAEYRASEDVSFVSSYKRTLESAFFYSSQKTDPTQITGLSPRLDALSGIPYASQVLPFGAASGNDNSSIWLVGWAPKKVYGIYSAGSVAGLQMKDLGDQLEDDGSGTGAQFLAHRSYFTWNCGFAVEDARYLVRIPNIDDDVLVGTGNALILAMSDAVEQLQSLEDCNPVFYMNRFVRKFLRKQAIDTTKNSTLTIDTIGGKRMLMFGEVPIHRTDALLSSEAPLT